MTNAPALPTVPAPSPVQGLQRGAWNDLCGACEHRYGDHYRTFDGDNTGCSEVDGLYPCSCEEFVSEA